MPELRDLGPTLPELIARQGSRQIAESRLVALTPGRGARPGPCRMAPELGPVSGKHRAVYPRKLLAQ